jgi:hypothetical protein
LLIQSLSREGENSNHEPLEVRIPKPISQQVRNALTGKLRKAKTKEQFSFRHSDDTDIQIEVARNCNRTCTFTATSSCGRTVTKTITAKKARTLSYQEIHEALKPALDRGIVLRRPQAQA